MKDRKELIKITKVVLEYMKKLESANIVANLFNTMIITAKKEAKTKQDQMRRFLEIAYSFKDKENIKQFSGGKKALDSAERFLNDFFKVSKEGSEFVLNNNLLKDLDIDELHYVFGWCRRLLKT